MYRIAGQGILLLYCFVSLLLVPVDTGFVVASLVTVVFVSSVFLQISDRRRMIFTFLFLMGACFFPKLLIFSPVVLYTLLDEVHVPGRDKNYGIFCGCGIMKYRRYLPGCLLVGLCVFFYMTAEPGLFVLIFFGCLFACLLVYQEGMIRKLEETFRRTRDDSKELNLLLEEKNQSLLKKQDDEIYTAKLKERNRIAREIHDNVGHMLSRAILMTGAMKAVNKDEAAGGALGELENTLHAAMTSIRESVHDLHDDSVNLKEVLSGLADNFSFCEAALTYDMGYALPGELKYSFIAIVKEGLNNVAKHSDASHVGILAREHPGMYQLVIEDNGSGRTGRKESGVSKEDRGIGLWNMKERVRALGGTVQISDKEGFRIYVTVPKKGESA